MKIKYIDGGEWDWLKSYSCNIMKSGSPYKGTISVISDTKVNYQLKVDNDESSLILFDEGYKCVTYVPDNGFWSVNAIYNKEDTIVEWYFDILKDKLIDEDGRLYYYDLYLDVVVSPGFKAILIDEDELKEALEAGIIDKTDCDFAYKIAEELLNVITKDKGFLVDFLGSQLK